MGFSNEDKILTKNLRDSKGYSTKKLVKEFPERLEQKWTVRQHRVYRRQIHSVDELKWRLIDGWCGGTVKFWRGCWLVVGRLRACVDAEGGHFECSLWTGNVDFVHICYIQCDLFDCYIFNYEIMPATLTNTFCSFLPRGAMHKRGLCRHAVSVCLCVCLSVRSSRSWIVPKRTKIFSNFFHRRVATPL